MEAQDLQRRLNESLFERIDETNFPSNELLDRTEASLTTREALEQYAELLVTKVENTSYPSSELIARAEGAVQQLAAVAESEESSRES